MKTYQPKGKQIKREWYLIDAKGEVLGRLATKIAVLLMGKQKVSFAPHLDSGDYVVVINASLIRVTGKKLKDKVYYRHTGYLGGLKEITLKELMKKDPKKVIWKAVEGMLPRNKLRDARLKRLKISSNEDHSYQDKIKTQFFK